LSAIATSVAGERKPAQAFFEMTYASQVSI
jgi:hypothetical protein